MTESNIKETLKRLVHKLEKSPKELLVIFLSVLAYLNIRYVAFMLLLIKRSENCI